MSTSSGKCLCGASSYEFDGNVKFAITCYCKDCQQMTGTGNLPQIGVSSDGFLTSGPIKSFSKPSDAGNELAFSFCGDCGSPLFKTTSKLPELRFVCAGSLDEAPDIAFEKKVFESSKQPWDNS